MKPQFSEEEAREFLIDAGVEEKYLKEYMPDLIKNNRIRKSDLEILIEEAEEIIKNATTRQSDSQFISIQTGELGIVDHCIQAIKAELNKRREG